ncbi:NADPH-dependent F420 reductase [Rhizorhabdus dicambivorans]|uniref:NADPH-dependent F420 reductase n=1 Tax=Rhizorhabdus dicambivorans TaxID=1850238 RepID=A0A2A4FRW2_9SPHN|nr:NADPH-dependent F420 reductase [Rhizorhabdus dicambivorans]ATE63816.1 NADPH-dependent F420 reductase [Rhizorhabdus dicambivorans]PCE40460.1 NADPH-dependent F420 reductase [Rhizorhabdus dicambivorans]
MAGNERIAVIGGTGKLGAAIARRLAKAGRAVVIGSRSAESAQAKATELGFGLTGMSNADAAQAGDVIIVTVPFDSQDTTLAGIKPYVAGKLVVDTTVPLVPPRVMRVQLPAEGSAAVRTRNALGDGVRIVSAFHSVAGHKLITDKDIECDVLVFGDDKADRQIVVELADAMGLRGIHGGALVNSAAAEALTSILIFINKTYQVDGAGIRITGELIQPDA